MTTTDTPIRRDLLALGGGDEEDASSSSSSANSPRTSPPPSNQKDKQAVAGLSGASAGSGKQADRWGGLGTPPLPPLSDWEGVCVYHTALPRTVCVGAASSSEPSRRGGLVGKSRVAVTPVRGRLGGRPVTPRPLSRGARPKKKKMASLTPGTWIYSPGRVSIGRTQRETTSESSRRGRYHGSAVVGQNDPAGNGAQRAETVDDHPFCVQGRVGLWNRRVGTLAPEGRKAFGSRRVGGLVFHRGRSDRP